LTRNIDPYPVRLASSHTVSPGPDEVLA
jgi:hypothetical protein